MRGSSEFHAWGDSNAFLRRIRGRLQLSIEHRAALGRDWMPLALTENPPVLEVVDQQPALSRVQPSCRERIEKSSPKRGNPSLKSKSAVSSTRAPAMSVARGRWPRDSNYRGLSTHRSAGVGACCLSRNLQELSFPESLPPRRLRRWTPAQCMLSPSRPPVVRLEERLIARPRPEHAVAGYADLK